MCGTKESGGCVVEMIFSPRGLSGRFVLFSLLDEKSKKTNRGGRHGYATYIVPEIPTNDVKNSPESPEQDLVS